MNSKKKNPGIGERLGAVETRLAVVENDVQWIKRMVRSLDYRVWALLVGIIAIILAVVVK